MGKLFKQISLLFTTSKFHCRNKILGHGDCLQQAIIFLLFWANSTKKSKCLLKMTFEYAEFDSYVLTIFFSFFWKYPLLTNFVKKIKFVCLRWNLGSRLIQDGDVHFFCFRSTKITVLKMKIFCLRWKNVFRLIQIC